MLVMKLIGISVLQLMQIKILILLLVGFCFAQDSTAIQLQIDKQIELGKTIQEQVTQGQLDLGKIEYSIFVLNEMLKPPKEEEIDEKDIN